MDQATFESIKARFVNPVKAELIATGKVSADELAAMTSDQVNELYAFYKANA